ncbi:hypothetical protein DRK59_20120 [Salmonella enterica subsp. diarizonae]|nr:hypothetical protein [Salmonella enterica]EAQ6117357.1 hypothetical protein [Salmonella enterica]ECE0110461.1 hypothetical protein [Salmonella enterica subsp. diarizonae]MLU19365.1 hypothetical protein [Salmonella enterica subsp. diarizonae]
MFLKSVVWYFIVSDVRYCYIIHKVNIFLLNLYPELSTNMNQVKIECDKKQHYGKMLRLLTSGSE